MPANARGDGGGRPLDLRVLRAPHPLMEVVELRPEVLEEEGQVVQLVLVEGRIGDEWTEASRASISPLTRKKMSRSMPA